MSTWLITTTPEGRPDSRFLTDEEAAQFLARRMSDSAQIAEQISEPEDAHEQP